MSHVTQRVNAKVINDAQVGSLRLLNYLSICEDYRRQLNLLGYCLMARGNLSPDDREWLLKYVEEIYLTQQRNRKMDLLRIPRGQLILATQQWFKRLITLNEPAHWLGLVLLKGEGKHAQLTLPPLGAVFNLDAPLVVEEDQELMVGIKIAGLTQFEIIATPYDDETVDLELQHTLIHATDRVLPA